MKKAFIFGKSNIGDKAILKWLQDSLKMENEYLGERVDLSKPFLVVKKINTFGAVLFKENYEIDRITTNKVYVFAGILYASKQYLEGQKTVAEIFRNVPKSDWRVHILHNYK